MDLSPDKVAALDQIYGGNQQASLAPDKIAALDKIYGQKPQIETTAGRTALDQGMQGATFGFADEGMDRIGAGIASLSTGEPYDKLLQEARANSKDRLTAEMQQRPVESIASNIGGALLTGGAGASTKAGAAVGDFLGSGGTLARIGKGALAGAASGGLYGAGSADDGQMAQGAKQGAVSGAVVGGAIPAVGALVKGAANEVRSLIPASAETSASLRSAASPYYNKFTQSGATYSSKLTDEIATLADAAKSKGIAGATKPADEALNGALDYYASLRGKTLTPSDIQGLDQSLSDDIARFNRAGEYNFGRILNNLKYEFRNRAFDPQKAASYVTGATPDAVNDLVKGNQLWSQSYKAKDIEKILAKANGTENPQSSIRTGLKNLLGNEKKMANYTDAEQAVLQEAMKRGVTGGLVKLMGGRLTDSVAGGIAGNSAAGPFGAVGGAMAGKAVGGVMADVAGGIQANRLTGALGKIQSGAMPASAAKAISPVMAATASGAVSPQGNPMLTVKQAMTMTPAQVRQLMQKK
jgi:hypothetical protein